MLGCPAYRSVQLSWPSYLNLTELRVVKWVRWRRVRSGNTPFRNACAENACRCRGALPGVTCLDELTADRASLAERSVETSKVWLLGSSYSGDVPWLSNTGWVAQSCVVLQTARGSWWDSCKYCGSSGSDILLWAVCSSLARWRVDPNHQWDRARDADLVDVQL